MDENEQSRSDVYDNKETDNVEETSTNGHKGCRLCSTVNAWERKYKRLVETSKNEKMTYEKDIKRLKDSISLAECENERLRIVESENLQLKKDIEQLTDFKAVFEANMHEIQSLEKQKRESQHENTKLKSKLQVAEIEIRSLQESIHILERGNKLLTEEKENLLVRLSKFAGAQLTVDNPNIADLSDGKRPTKLAEEFAELYDNEWTDAFENINLKQDRSKTDFMLKLLQRTSQICKLVTVQHMRDITSLNVGAVTSSTSSSYTAEHHNLLKKGPKGGSLDEDILDDYEVIDCDEAGEHVQMTEKMVQPITCDIKTLTADQIKSISEVKRIIADHHSVKLQSVVTNIVALEYNIDRQGQVAIIKYITKCADVCWTMFQQDPPVFFDFPETKENTCLDTNVYKPYTKSGKYIDFIVWPALYLFMGGPLLCKGVAQGRS